MKTITVKAAIRRDDLFVVPENETPQLIMHPVSRNVYESRRAAEYSCNDCPFSSKCMYAFDTYCTYGDCLDK